MTRFQLLADPVLLVALVVDLLVIAVIVLVPLHHRYPDDLGDGRSVVLTPPPNTLSVWRPVRAIVAFLVVGGAERALWGTWSLSARYKDVVDRIAGAVVRAPSEIHSAEFGVALGVRGVLIAAIVGTALGVTAPLARRLLMLGHVLLYLAASVVLDVLTLTVTVLFPDLEPLRALLGPFVTLVVGLLVMLRMIFASFVLPAATTLPRLPRARRADRHDSILLVLTTLAGMILAGCLCALILARVPLPTRSLVLLFLPLPFAGLSTFFRIMLLHGMHWASEGPPPLPAVLPPVEVIIPAYNEEAQIVDTLQAIDTAAGVYGGPVHVILANDASTDATESLARGTVERFRWATGTVLTAKRGGKSASLNAALQAGTAEIVIRIDADTHIEQRAIRNAVRWFARPEIGLVEAMVIPKPGGSFFRRMRVFETLRIHGFMHPAYQMVDAVNVVPGMFTAFRREGAEAIGGFTAGMNGEDADFTLQMGRLGYRTWQDSKVIMYEDVPETLAGFREQRSRWSRATIMAFARHSPFRLGPGSPQSWFTQTRMMLFRPVAVARLAAWIYVPLVALFSGTYQLTVVAFIFSWLGFIALLAIVDAVVAARTGLLGRMGWFVFIIPFTMVRQFFTLEGLLSLPARPVRLPGRAAAPIDQQSLQPVVH